MEEINCFKCTKPMDKKGAILLSSPEEFFSDNVDKVSKYHLCKDCEEIIMKFILGQVKETQVPPKLHLLIELINNENIIPQRKVQRINEIVRSLLQELHSGVSN